uniref:AMP-activated protein kinase glycogen-binding domain-containing protein n=1 Tax=Arundo donax TaxID=35708 RepID=A0A0A9CVH3_ARUDO
MDAEGENFVPTLIEWNYAGQTVLISGSWNNWTWIPLEYSGQKHSVVVNLKPGVHWFLLQVDGVYCVHPGYSWQTKESGFIFNSLSVNGILPQDNDEEYLVSISWKHESESVYVKGSWDGWATSKKMEYGEPDHYLLLKLPPGRHLFQFFVDGKWVLEPKLDIERDLHGTPISNCFEVQPENPDNFFFDATGIMPVNDFLAQKGNEVTATFHFNVGSLLGNIDSEATMSPCTEIGYMVLNGYFACAMEAYRKGYSWGGCFKERDMRVIDGRHFQIRKRPTLLLTRARLLLDNFQLKQSLLLKFEKDGNYPPYFTHLIWLLEHPPGDFDTNEEAKLRYLDKLEHHPALAFPSRRMQALVSIAQFFKQLPENDEEFAFTFNKLLAIYYNWQNTVHGDDLLELLYMDGKKIKTDKQGRPLEPVPNSGLHMSNFLRVFLCSSPRSYTYNSGFGPATASDILFGDRLDNCILLC